jgi:ADP-heptose:LPS heptosyltransferase
MPKILIIRFSSIGDIVLTTPVIRCLKEQLRDAELHVLTKKQFAPLFQGNPHISRIIAIEKKIHEVMPELRSQKYDLIVDLHRNVRSLGVKAGLLRPSSTFPKLNIRKWMLVNWKIDLMPNLHLVDRYFKAVEKLGIRNDGKGLDFFIPENERIEIIQLPATHQIGYITFAIGGKHATKILPVEKIINICRLLKQPVILLGGPEDKIRGDTVARQAGPLTINYCGALTIHQSASIIEQASCVITHDTGLMHIAAAFRKRIISIWGSTVPGFGMRPYLPAPELQKSVVIGVMGLSCRPCSKIGFDKCPKKHFRCMNDIKEETVAGLAMD